jgi:methionyl-tRNA formyltransferase
MGNIKWKLYNSQKIYKLWKALGETYGIYAKYEFLNERVRLYKLHSPEEIKFQSKNGRDSEFEPGMLQFDKTQNILFIKCIDGWIGCSEIQVNQRNRMDASSFVNGYEFRGLNVPDKLHKFDDV